MSVAALEAHLLPAALPNGGESNLDLPLTDGQTDSPDTSPPVPGCDNLSTGQDIVDAATASASASAVADILVGHTGEAGVSGGWETLFSFPGDGAHQAMQAMRALVGKCGRTAATFLGDGWTTAFSIAAGPRLGDESLVVGADVKFANTPGVAPSPDESGDAVVVRVGTTLIAIDSMPLSRQQFDEIQSLMPLAVAQLTSAHPGPVGTPEPTRG